MVETVSIDFDGVIHKYNRGWQDGVIYGGLMPGAWESLQQLLTKYAIVVQTARDIHQTRNWLKAHGLKVIASNDIRHWDVMNTILVTNMKPAAIAYIDDRAIRFTNWEQTLDDLEKLKF